MYLYMNDFYSAKGTTLKGFRKAINEFEGNLVHRVVKMDDITFVLLKDGTKGCPINKENYDRLQEMTLTGEGKLTIEDYEPLKEEEPELFEENRIQSGLLLSVGPDTFFVSANAIPTIGTRLGLGGTKYENKTFSRNLRIAQAVREIPDNPEVILVCLKREDRKTDEWNGMKTIAIPSGEYVHIPLTWMATIAMRFAKDGTLGRPKATHWSLSHTLVSFEMEFPEYAEQLKEEYGFKELLIPGIHMETSPVTRSSFEVIGTLRPERGYAIDDSCEKLTHRGHVDIDAYIERVEKTVLAGVRKMSEELGKKLGSSLTSSEDEKDREEAYTRAILAGFEDLKLSKALGERRAKEIKEGLLEEFNCDIPYTEYDIATLFLHLPERVDPLTENTKKSLRIACKRAAFIDYKPSRMLVLPE